MTLKPKNNCFNQFVVIGLPENLLNNKIGSLFQKFENIQIQNGPPAAILNRLFLRRFQQLVHEIVPLGCDHGHM